MSAKLIQDAKQLEGIGDDDGAYQKYSDVYVIELADENGPICDMLREKLGTYYARHERYAEAFSMFDCSLEMGWPDFSSEFHRIQVLSCICQVLMGLNKKTILENVSYYFHLKYERCYPETLINGILDAYFDDDVSRRGIFHDVFNIIVFQLGFYFQIQLKYPNISFKVSTLKPLFLEI